MGQGSIHWRALAAEPKPGTGAAAADFNHGLARPGPVLDFDRQNATKATGSDHSQPLVARSATKFGDRSGNIRRKPAQLKTPASLNPLITKTLSQRLAI